MTRHSDTPEKRAEAFKRRLALLNDTDPEGAHAEADAILLEALEVLGGSAGESVADAYRATKRSAKWWAFA